MIYRYKRRSMYYAGINYFTRVENIYRVYVQTGYEREDTWEYKDIEERNHIIYRGVDLAKGIYATRITGSYINGWLWYDKDDDCCVEDYPDDL